jgi:DNA-binding beta-propeller fold protein YncE
VLLAGRLAAATGDAGVEDCLLGWRVAGGTPGRAGLGVRCRDGDPVCDDDGTADGGCTFATTLCLRLPGCEQATPMGLRVRGRLAAPLAAAASALADPAAGPGVCTAPSAVRVDLGRHRRRRATLRASARDAGSGRTARERLSLSCERAAGARGPRAFVVTTDFETGGLAAVDVATPHRTVQGPAVHRDAVVRVTGGLVIVVNRFLGDNLQVLDPTAGLKTVLQCSTVPGSNPHDAVVVGPHRAYVTRYNKTDLWIVDPTARSCDGFHIGSIDLGPYADADGIPEMDQMALVGDRVFVTLQRLDQSRGFQPTRQSLVAVVDTTSDRVEEAIPLTGTNPFGDATGLAREPGTGKLVVTEVGSFFRTDGGVERVDPLTRRAEGFFITEATLGGDVTDVLLVSAVKGYAVVQTPALENLLVAFDPATGTVVRRLLTRTEALPDIGLAPDGTLWLADQGLPTPGVRIFDVTTDRQLTARPIDVGLPPFSMGFLP